MLTLDKPVDDFSTDYVNWSFEIRTKSNTNLAKVRTRLKENLKNRLSEYSEVRIYSFSLDTDSITNALPEEFL